MAKKTVKKSNSKVTKKTSSKIVNKKTASKKVNPKAVSVKGKGKLLKTKNKKAPATTKKNGSSLKKQVVSVKASQNKKAPISAKANPKLEKKSAKAQPAVVEVAPKKRGRPPKAKPEGSELLVVPTGPKKRGRKSKAELLAAQGLSPEAIESLNGTSANGVPLGQPIKRKRGRPRKNEQYGATSADLTSELMQRGIRRFGLPFGKSEVPVARYSWSAETGEHVAGSTANFTSADSGVEEFSVDDVEFSKGDKVVYPAHGLGVVQAIQSRLVGGAQQKFYMIAIVETGMKIMVPVSQSKTVGLRRVVDTSTVDRVYAILKDKSVAIDNQTWNRRYREYSQKIKTGSVLEIASVIRDLTVLKVEKELSFNERRMLDTAQGLLVKELSIAKAASEEIIKEELEQICQI